MGYMTIKQQESGFYRRKKCPLSDPKVGDRSSYVLLSFRTVNLWGVQDVCGGR